jgi:hypothetical protein
MHAVLFFLTMQCYYYEYRYASFLSFLSDDCLFSQADIAIRSIIIIKAYILTKIATYLEHLCYIVTYLADVHHLHSSAN